MKRILLIVSLLLSFLLQGQKSEFWIPSDTLNPVRRNWVVYGGGGVAVTSLVGLYTIWYSDYPQSGFHFVNDNANWLWMDKLGHSTTAYFVGEMGYSGLRWAGVKEGKALWYGGLTGWSYLTVVEVMDGLSDGWGFSWGDMTANTLGAALFIGQQAGWKEQRIRLKFSYSPTDYPDYAPDLLGKDWTQQWLKDYNGQTYWLSVNPNSFQVDWMPKWLNVAVGYGADGMIGASENPLDVNGLDVSNIERKRQYYLSLDLDLSRIPVKRPWLRSVFSMINFIKIPAPALEFQEGGGVRFHALYF